VGAAIGFHRRGHGHAVRHRRAAYAIYLSRRLSDKGALRATLSNMVLLSVSIRALVFAASGFMLADRLIGFAMLAPFVLAGCGSATASTAASRAPHCCASSACCWC